MTRVLPEWVGKTPDSSVPPRVKVRIFIRYNGECQCGCGTRISVGDKWDCEDEIAIINGGERREKNLRPFLTAHHPQKTARDVAIKSKTYRMAKKHLGIKKSSRPMVGSKASPWKRKMDGSIIRR